VRRLPPLRPRVLYLGVWGLWPFPLFLGLPLFLLEWTLLVLLLWKAWGKPGPRVPWGVVLAFRTLPPLLLFSLEVGRMRVKGGLW